MALEKAWITRGICFSYFVVTLFTFYVSARHSLCWRHYVSKSVIWLSVCCPLSINTHFTWRIVSLLSGGILVILALRRAGAPPFYLRVPLLLRLLLFFTFPFCRWL